MPKRKASSKCISRAAGTDWAAEDFDNAQLGDARLVKRLKTIVTDFAKQPTASIPQACGKWATSKAAYRFFDNDSVEAQAILDSHVQATVHRMSRHSTVLCIQDTTTLNYSTHPRTQGLGPVGNNRDKTVGLLLHSTLAVTPSGHALGLLQARTWARDPRQYGCSSQKRNAKPISKKESKKWLESYSVCQSLSAQCPKTILINVADREGDLYDLFLQATRATQTPRVELLVRAQHNRKVAHPQHYLWKFLSTRRLAGHLEIKVPRHGATPARLAKLAIRFTRVTLHAPGLKEEQPSVTLWAIEARERRAPKPGQPICWRLLTTQAVLTLEEALEKIRWYTQRWQIEVMHKVLKSGCQVEQRQLETDQRLKRVFMVDLIVAWRVMSLCQAAREMPEGRASDWLSAEEWQALSAYRDEPALPGRKSPCIRDAVRSIARLGGFLARKGDGEPGPTVLWRGLQLLSVITEAWIRFSPRNCG